MLLIEKSLPKPLRKISVINAKVTRDFNLENWKPTGTSLEFDRDFGSGYPSGTSF